MSAWSPADLLSEFHERPGVDIERPETPTLDVPNLFARVDYLREEVMELEEALELGDLVGVADALADITYLVYGTAWRTGIPLDAVLVEVHRSNMTKTPSPGDGKAIKGPGYSPPKVAAVLDHPEGHDSAQIWRGNWWIPEAAQAVEQLVTAAQNVRTACTFQFSTPAERVRGAAKEARDLADRAAVIAERLEPMPRWAVDVMAGWLMDAEHCPATEPPEADVPGVFCSGCSDANEGYVPWPCAVAVLAGPLVRAEIEKQQSV